MTAVLAPGPAGKQLFWCGACGTPHWFDGRWAWNGDRVRPTVRPSIHVPVGPCHLFVEGGRLVYLPDCGHALAGKVVPMEPVG